MHELSRNTLELIWDAIGNISGKDAYLMYTPTVQLLNHSRFSPRTAYLDLENASGVEDLISGLEENRDDLAINVNISKDTPWLSPGWKSSTGELLKFDIGLALLVDDSFKYKTNEHLSVKAKNQEVYVLERLLERVGERIVVLTSGKWLSLVTGGDKSFKEKLLGVGHCIRVTALSDVGYGFAISKFRQDMYLLEVAKEKNCEAVEFRVDIADIDRSERIGIGPKLVTFAATFNDVQDRYFSLNPNRYSNDEVSRALNSFGRENLGTQRLDELVEFVRVQSNLTNDFNETRGMSQGDARVEVIDAEHVPRTGYISDAREVLVNSKNFSEMDKKRFLRKDDLLLVIKSRAKLGAVGLVNRAGTLTFEPEDYLGFDEVGIRYGDATITQSLMILRMRAEAPMSAVSLYKYLSSPLGAAQLRKMAVGEEVKIIQMSELKSLAIPNLSTDAQEEIAEHFRRQCDLKQEILMLIDKLNLSTFDYWDYQGKREFELNYVRYKYDENTWFERVTTPAEAKDKEKWEELHKSPYFF